jgi:hypothetical protein
MLPSWIRSRNCRPRLVYFLAIDTTRRRLASTSSALALLGLALAVLDLADGVAQDVLGEVASLLDPS